MPNSNRIDKKRLDERFYWWCASRRPAFTHKHIPDAAAAVYRPVQSPHWVLHHHGVSVGSQSPLLGTRATVVESGREVHNLFSLSPPPPL